MTAPGRRVGRAQAFGKVLSGRRAGRALSGRTNDHRHRQSGVLISGSVRRKTGSNYVDKLAAAVILEQWLASQSGAAERGMTYGE
ncbi:MAG: hypothetical protein ACLUE8_16625 [Lachnospiraceae bacterium]